MRIFVGFIFSLAFLCLAEDEWLTYTNTDFVNDVEIMSAHLYAATSGGLLKINTADFSIEKIDKSDGLPSVTCTALEKDSYGNLWVGCAQGNLTRISPRGVLQNFGSYAEDEWHINYLSSHKNYLLVASNKGLGVFSVDSNYSIRNFTKFGTIEATEVLDVDVVRDTVFALIMGDSVSREVLAYTWINWDTLNAQNLEDPGIWNTRPVPFVYAIEENADSLMLSYYLDVKAICGNRYDAGAYIIKNNLPIAALSGVAVDPQWNISKMFDKYLTSITGDGACLLWMGTAGGGVLMYNGNTWRTFKIDGPVSNFAHRIEKDNSDAVWITSGTLPVTTDYGSGVSRLKNNTWNHYTAQNTPAFRGSNRISAIQQHPNGKDLLIGVHGGGIAIYRSDGSWGSYTMNNSALVSTFQSVQFEGVTMVHIDALSRIWASIERKGLVVMDTLGLGKNIQTGIDNDNMFSMAIDSSNMVWTGYNSNYSVYDTSGTNVTFQYAHTSGITGLVYNIRVDDSNGVWYAADGGLARFYRDTTTAGNWKLLLEGKQVRDLAFSPPTIYNAQPLLWAGIYNTGIQLLTLEGKLIRSFTAENSKLVSNKINGLFFDSSTAYLWVATDEGVSVLKTGLFTPKSDFTDFTLSKTRENGQSLFSFDRLPDASSIAIYTIDGRLVKEIKADSQRDVRWYLDNNLGNMVKPGIYYFSIKAKDAGILKGKLLVR